MIHAYQEIYLNRARVVLGDAFDYAVNSCGISGSDFVQLFVGSSICKRMENGEPACIAGMSGPEIVVEIIRETKGIYLDIAPKVQYERSVEYWIGWVVAYYQWYTGKRYNIIFDTVSYEEFGRMYYTLHEADASKLVEVVDLRMKECYPDTSLKRLRTFYGITQAELARRSGVSLRSIQMYEQRNKDITKASADTIYRLAKVLGCDMEELIL